MFYVKQILIILAGFASIALGLIISIKVEPSLTTFALTFMGTWIILDAYHKIRGRHFK